MKNINSGRGFKYGALLVAVLIVGCGNEKGDETEAHSHNQEGGGDKRICYEKWLHRVSRWSQ